MKKYTIIVDPGYMFDFLSIYYVKSNKKETLQNERNSKEAEIHIIEQIGAEKFDEIVNSQEFANLYTVNIRLYDLVDEVKKDTCKGKELDNEVFNRYKAKVALQNKFFPETIVKEQKFGY